VVLQNLATVAYQSLPEAAIGRASGAHDVGLYSRANGTVGLFQQVVGPTMDYNALPVIAKAYHEGPEALRAILTHSSQLLTVLAWPIYIWIALFPTEIIGLLYGPTWTPAASLAPWLCASAAARAPFMMIATGLHAANRPYESGMATVAGLLSRLAVLTVIGIQDLHQLVMLMLVADVLALAAWIRPSRQYLGLGLWANLVLQGRSAAVGLTCLAAALLTRFALSGLGLSPLPVVLVSGLAVGAGWLASLFFVGHPFADELRKFVHKLH
jgi:O-antigen/teichoic acid export membrane protein